MAITRIEPNIISLVPQGAAGVQGPPGEQVWYTTRAAAVAASVPVGIQGFRTLGYAALNDGGHALWVRVGSEPAHPGKLQSTDGAWWELDRYQVITPEQFGAVGNGAADDTTAIQNLFTAVAVFGDGWNVRFKKAASYSVFPAIVAYTTLVSLTGKHYWTIDFNGAKLLTKYTLPADPGFPADIFVISQCKGWEIRRFNLEHQTPLASGTKGNNGLTIYRDCTDFRVIGFRQLGGIRGFGIVRFAGDLAYGRCKRWRLEQGYFEDVEYPFSLQNDGDFGYFEVDAKRGGRTCAVYGFRKIKGLVWSEPSNTVEDFIISATGNYSGSSFIGATEDFDIEYTASNVVAPGGVMLTFTLTSPHSSNPPAILRNGRVRLNGLGSSFDWGSVIHTQANRRTLAEAIENGDAAGYEINDVVITGNHYGNVTSSFGEIGRTTEGFSSLTIINMTISNFVAPSIDKALNIGPFANVVLNNIVALPALSAQWPDGASSGRFAMVASRMGGMGSDGATASAISALRLLSNTPTAPVDGVLWYDGTNLKARLGGVTKTITVS